jgi:hypothetical protein
MCRLSSRSHLHPYSQVPPPWSHVSAEQVHAAQGVESERRDGHYQYRSVRSQRPTVSRAPRNEPVHTCTLPRCWLPRAWSLRSVTATMPTPRWGFVGLCLLHRLAGRSLQNVVAGRQFRPLLAGISIAAQPGFQRMYMSTPPWPTASCLRCMRMHAAALSPTQCLCGRCSDGCAKHANEEHWPEPHLLKGLTQCSPSKLRWLQAEMKHQVVTLVTLLQRQQGRPTRPATRVCGVICRLPKRNRPC